MNIFSPQTCNMFVWEDHYTIRGVVLVQKHGRGVKEYLKWVYVQQMQTFTKQVFFSSWSY
jgi:hypothetical protein